MTGVLCGVGLAAGLVMTNVGGASNNPTAKAPPHSQGSALARGLAYYRGKTMTFVSPDKPGGGFDQWARLVAPALASYLHATVNVDNIPAGNTVAGQNEVAHSAQSGLTVGWLNAGPDIENNVLNLPALNFNPLREAFLGATAAGQTAILSLNSPSCPRYSSFASFVRESTAAQPAHEVLQTSGTGTFFMLMVNESFGIHFRPLTGYASTADQVQGFVRGDGCITEMPAAVADGLVTTGKARVLALSLPMQKQSAISEDYASAPTIAQEAAQLHSVINSTARRNAFAALTDVDSSTRVFFAPSATPTPQVTALRAAFKWAMNNGAVPRTRYARATPLAGRAAPRRSPSTSNSSPPRSGRPRSCGPSSADYTARAAGAAIASGPQVRQLVPGVHWRPGSSQRPRDHWGRRSAAGGTGTGG